METDDLAASIIKLSEARDNAVADQTGMLEFLTEMNDIPVRGDLLGYARQRLKSGFVLSVDFGPATQPLSK